MLAQSPLEKTRRSNTPIETASEKENFRMGFYTTVYNSKMGEGKAMNNFIVLLCSKKVFKSAQTSLKINLLRSYFQLTFLNVQVLSSQ